MALKLSRAIKLILLFGSLAAVIWCIPTINRSRASSTDGDYVGCEACYGPGKAHLEEGDLAKIISFKTKPFQHPINLGDISMFQCADCH